MRYACVITLLACLFSANVCAAGTLLHDRNIGKISQALTELRLAVRIMNSMLLENEIAWSSADVEKRFYQGHRGLVNALADLEHFLESAGGASDGRADVGLLLAARKAVSDAYWAFNQMIYLNELTFNADSGDYRFHQAQFRQMNAIILIGDYIENGRAIAPSR